MDENLPVVAGHAQRVPPGASPDPPLEVQTVIVEVQTVMEAADLAHHRIRRSIQAINSVSHRIVDFVARHQGTPDIARLEHGRDDVQLQMYRDRGMR